MGWFSNKKTSSPDPPPMRRDHVHKLLKLGMEWYGGDPDGDDFEANRDRYYQALKGCTRAEVDYVEDALERHGYPP
ncbi:hypothetical protein ACIBQ1_10045 [Nonomuraea sp. NPDC050153]|uniref:hypothetical protein n=1 Tax=Nonomuraea sp. NPDC050153 TaxID=3364359 RepID=UPI0037AF4C3A